jgi:glycosyltransferase involved in cell wall biosynthesis
MQTAGHDAAALSARAAAGRARRLLIVQPNLDPPGGGSGVAAWIIEALKRDYRLTVLSFRRPNLAEINRIFGSDLRPGDFELVLESTWLLRALARQRFSLQLWKDALLMRRARRMAARFDLVISTANEHDLGGRGLQYVHYPRFASLRPALDLRARYHGPLPVRLYRGAALRMSGTSLARVAANRTLANSAWVGALYRDTHGAPAETLHPPAAGPFPPVAWTARESGAVCVGRLAPEKRLELVIEIVERVRARGHALRLHLAGTGDDRAYTESIRALARARADWLTLHEGLSRPGLCELMARHRYGVHGMADEHFGMAVAELVSAGCIAFVPDGGGQREIVGGEPRLLWRGAGDAADKIAAVLADASLQEELRAHLAAQRARFTPEHFVARIRAVVAECVA